MKVPIDILRRLNTLLILYLDDILLIARSQKELITGRDTLIFLLQNLGFPINFEKSVQQPCQNIEFLGIVVDSRDMTLTLPQEKVNPIIDHCQLFLSRDQVALREIAQLIGKLSYSAVAVLPAPLHYRSLQRHPHKVLLDLAKEIWNHLLANGIMITVEYLPGTLNLEADHLSRSATDSSK